jgi:GTP-binding protein
MIINVVFIGKTNAGKSALFNEIVGESASIVNEKENMTIDAVMRMRGDICFFDTPGIDSVVNFHNVYSKIRRISVLCIVIPADERVNRFYTDLIKYSPAMYTCIIHSKTDVVRYNHMIDEISGIDSFHVSIFDKNSIKKLREVLCRKAYELQDSVNALEDDFNELTEHNRDGTHVCQNDEYDDENDSDIENEQNIEFCIFGRANVGKSTIANSIIGYERFVTRDEIGTTLEVNHSIIKNRGVKIIVSDTPGYRKNKDIDDISLVSQGMVNQYLNKSWHYNNICCVVLNASDGFTRTDQKIIDEAIHGFVTMIVVNKSDLVSDVILQDIIDDIRNRYAMVQVMAVSALIKNDINRLKRAMVNMIHMAKINIRTPDLNRWVQSLGLTQIKYGVHINGVYCKIFTKKVPQKNEQVFIEKSFCRWFNLRGIRPALEFICQ